MLKYLELWIDEDNDYFALIDGAKPNDDKYPYSLIQESGYIDIPNWSYSELMDLSAKRIFLSTSDVI